MPSAPTRRARAAAIALTSAGLLAAGVAGAVGAPHVEVGSPQCSAPGLPGTLATHHAWTAITDCRWEATFYHLDPDGENRLEHRVSTDDGATWSAPSPVAEVEAVDGNRSRAIVRLAAEGVQRVQFRSVDAAGARGPWLGGDYARVDRSGPGPVAIGPGGLEWADPGAEAAGLRLEASDPLSGPAWIEVRVVLARGDEQAPGEEAGWWVRGGCGPQYALELCRTEPAGPGRLRGRFAAPAGDWWLSARACDAVWNCGEWGPPVRRRVAVRDGSGSSLLTGTPGTDNIDAGAGSDTVAGDAGDDLLAGGSGADRLTGGPGDDRLTGGPGADRIAGGPGLDTIRAGSGADRIDAVGGGRDRVSCGPGRDTVRADRGDRVARDCERVIRVGAGTAAPRRAS